MTQTDEASIWRKLGDDADELAMRLQATPNAPRRVIEAAHGLLELHRKVRPELYSSPDRQNYTITVYRPQNRSRTIIALTALNNRTQAEALKALRATRKKLNPELAAELTDASGELVRSHQINVERETHRGCNYPAQARQCAKGQPQCTTPNDSENGSRRTRREPSRTSPKGSSTKSRARARSPKPTVSGPSATIRRSTGSS